MDLVFILATITLSIIGGFSLAIIIYSIKSYLEKRKALKDYKPNKKDVINELG